MAAKLIKFLNFIANNILKAKTFLFIGISVVLFTENYDLHLTGYHDNNDIMDNIDLDYGTSLAAIAIETVRKVVISEKI